MPEDPVPAASAQPIAIVGVACRFPDADDAPALLEMCLAGRRAFRRVPSAQLDPARRRPASPAEPERAGPVGAAPAPAPARAATHRAALIEGWRFDRGAFGISESAYLVADPARWLALETAGRALADAGFPGGQGVPEDRAGVIFGTGAIASRISGQFGFRGGGQATASQATTTTTTTGSQATGSQATGSAYSSALLAVAAACSSLTADDLDFALAGGVHLSLDPSELSGLAQAGLLAADDMRVYDSSPTGFLPGEGCGVVALMRAADARAAGIPAYAEIIGWARSAAGWPGEDGPDPGSELQVLRWAYEHADVDPTDVQLIEGAGRGTAAGDLAELTALVTIRAGAASAAALGSVTANIGRARAAAGAAGLIKTALAVNAGVIPPATGCARPHPLLGAEDATLRVVRAAEPWPGGTRLAAVSAMDSGGSNVHIVLRSGSNPGGSRDTSGGSRDTGHGTSPDTGPGPAALRRAPAQVRGGLRARSWTVSPHLRADSYLFSGSSRAVVSGALARVAALAPGLSDGEFTDLACQLGRTAHDGPVRVAVVASRQDDLSRLASQAAALLPGLAGGRLTVRPGIFASDGARGRVVLLFPGQSPGQDAPAIRCWGVAIVHASLAALHWLDRLGVQAAAAVGHGLGEITGLVWAGCLSESDAARLVAQRDAVVSTPDPQRSGMICVTADTATAQALCAGRDLVIAAYNGPRCHVLAGSAAAVRDVSRRGARDGVPVYVLAADNGLHSPVMADRVAPLRSVLAGYEFAPPSRRLMSTVTGRELTAADDIARLLGSQLTSPVRFAEALGAATADADLLIEAGPGQALAGLAAGCCDVPVVSLASGHGDAVAASRAAAALFAAGAISSLAPLLAGRPARPIDIEREQVFITSPREETPHTDVPRPRGAGPHRTTVRANGSGPRIRLGHAQWSYRPLAPSDAELAMQRRQLTWVPAHVQARRVAPVPEQQVEIGRRPGDVAVSGPGATGHLGMTRAHRDQPVSSRGRPVGGMHAQRARARLPRPAARGARQEAGEQFVDAVRGQPRRNLLGR